MNDRFFFGLLFILGCFVTATERREDCGVGFQIHQVLCNCVTMRYVLASFKGTFDIPNRNLKRGLLPLDDRWFDQSHSGKSHRKRIFPQSYHRVDEARCTGILCHCSCEAFFVGFLLGWWKWNWLLLGRSVDGLEELHEALLRVGVFASLRRCM